MKRRSTKTEKGEGCQRDKKVKKRKRRKGKYLIVIGLLIFKKSKAKYGEQIKI